MFKKDGRREVKHYKICFVIIKYLIISDVLVIDNGAAHYA